MNAGTLTIILTLLFSLSVILNFVFGVYLLKFFASKKEKRYQAKEAELENQRNLRNIYTTRFNLLNRWLEKRNNNRNISLYLKEKGIDCVGVYGMGSIGERLLEELQNIGNIRVAFIADKKWVFQGGRYHDIPVISLNLIPKYPEVKAIIVTPLFDWYNIRNELLKITPDLDVIGIDEIISRL